MTEAIRNKKVQRGVILAVVALAVVAAMVLRDRRGEEAAPAVAQTAAANTAETLPTLLDLGADKCIPCKAMVPVLAELTEGLAGHLTVQFIDVWQNPDRAKPYGIKLIPTQIFLDPDGKELFRHEGFFGRDDILAAWRDLGYAFTLPAKDQG